MPTNPLSRLVPKLSEAATVIRARRSKKKLSAVGACIVLGVAAILIAEGPWLHGDLGSWARIVLAFGESLLVAGILAILADPFVQRRFAEEWGQGVFWAIFNKDAPPKLRDAVNAIAQPKMFVRHCQWLITFEWANVEKTEVTMTVEGRRRIKCVDTDGMQKIPGGSGIVPRCTGEPSEFTAFSLDHSRGNVQLFAADVAKYVTVDEVGNSHLDPSPALTDIQVRYREDFSMSTTMTTTTRAVDSLPLFNGHTTMFWAVIVRGSAVEDLSFELFGSALPGLRLPTVKEDETGAVRLEFKSKEQKVTFPGHGLVLQWRPRDGAALPAATTSPL